MTNKEKAENLIFKTENNFFEYLDCCGKLVNILDKIYPKEKEYIKEIVYQSSDGLCVVYENEKETIPINIPVREFIKGVRI